MRRPSGRGKGKGKVTRGFTRKGGLYTGKFTRTRELKYLDTPTPANWSHPASDMTAGVIFPTICVVKQGSSATERIGRKIFIKRVQAKLKIHLLNYQDATGTGDMSNQRVRILMYLDKQANGAAATVTTLLANSTIAGGLVRPEIHSWRNMEHVDRYRILYDKVHTIAYTASGRTSDSENDLDNVLVSNIKSLSFGKNCNIEILYSLGDGILAEIQSNNIGMLLLTEEGGVFGKRNNLVVEGMVRIRYTD